MPVTLSMIASGVQLAGGVAQMLGSGKDKEQARLEKFAKNSPLKPQSKTINDYYGEALNRYNENPYQSAAYQMAQLQANRSNAAGLNALGQSNMGAKLGAVGRMTQMRNDALQRAGVQAEGMKNQRFGQLGQAAQMKQNEENQLFDINQMTPYNRQLGLQQYKTQAANERYNAGMGMIGQGISSGAQVASAYAMANPKDKKDTGLSGAINPNLFGISPLTNMSNNAVSNANMANPNWKPGAYVPSIPSRKANWGIGNTY